MNPQKPDWERLWQQIEERNKYQEPPTFKCPICRDTQYVPGPNVYKFNMTYTTAKPCACLQAERAAFKRRKVSLPPEEPEREDRLIEEKRRNWYDEPPF